MEDKISVIIPVYNVEKYISRCLDSILNQSYKNVEIIIINDGSTDKSGLICDEYSKRYDNIRVFHKENGGVSSARNLGITVAKGEYITFADPDDFLNKDMYKILYDNAKNNNSDITICSVNEIRENVIDTEDNTGKIIKYSREDAINGYFNDIYPFNHNYLWNKLFKREMFDEVKLNEKITYQEDSEVMIKLLNLSENIIYVGIPLYNYDLRLGSLSSGNISKSKITAERAFYSIYEYTKENICEYKDKALLKYISLVFNIVIEIIKSGDQYNDDYINIGYRIKEIYWQLIKTNSIPIKYKIHSTLIILSPRLYKIYIKNKL